MAARPRIPGYTVEYVFNTEEVPVLLQKYKQFQEALQSIGVAASKSSWTAFVKGLAERPEHAGICRGRFRSTVFSDDTTVVLVKDGDRIIGAMSLDYYPISNEIFVSHICVNATAKGLGTHLLQIANDVGKQLGAVRIRLQVGISEEDAEGDKLLQWYISQGFNYENPDNKAKQSHNFPKMSKAVTRKSRRTGRRAVRRKTRRRG